MLNKLKKLLNPAILAILCGIVIFLYLNFPTPIGVSNNGDFTRIISEQGINYLDSTRAFSKFQKDYTMNLGGSIHSFLVPDLSKYEYYSSQSIFISLSKVLNLAVNKITSQPLDTYNLQVLGFLNIVLFSFALYLILSFFAKRNKIPIYLIFLILLFVFCDQGYTAYFSSFFGENVQYIWTLMSIGIFLKLIDTNVTKPPEKEDFEQKRNATMLRWKGKVKKHYIFWIWLTVYFVSVAIMGTSKYGYVPVGVLFALLPLSFWASWGFIKKIIISAITIILLLLGVKFYNLVPNYITRDTLIDSVFDGVAIFTNNPSAELKKIGLPAEYASLQGKGAYDPASQALYGSQKFDSDFFAKISEFSILKYYITNPSRFYNAMRFTAYSGGKLNQTYLSNNVNGGMSYRFSIWENIRSLGFIKGFKMTQFIIYASFITFCILLFTRRKKYLPQICLYGALILSAVYGFVIPFLANGEADISKHLFGFTYFYDMLIIIDLFLLYFLIRYLIAHPGIKFWKRKPSKLPEVKQSDYFKYKESTAIKIKKIIK